MTVRPECSWTESPIQQSAALRPVKGRVQTDSSGVTPRISIPSPWGARSYPRRYHSPATWRTARLTDAAFPGRTYNVDSSIDLPVARIDGLIESPEHDRRDEGEIAQRASGGESEGAGHGSALPRYFRFPAASSPPEGSTPWLACRASRCSPFWQAWRIPAGARQSCSRSPLTRWRAAGPLS